MKLNPIAITMGCPAGIGPEIIIKALSSLQIDTPVIVIGDINILKRAKKLLSIDIEIKALEKVTELSAHKKNQINCLSVTDLSSEKVPFGMPTELTGSASFSYITEGIKLCQKGLLSALVTAPISKIGLKKAGIDFPGHTEILAHMTGTKNYIMMMAGKKLKVTLVTIHCPLKDVPNLINENKVLDTIKITHASLKKDFGIKRPKLALCGLNPHAGENGMFGTEEIEILDPACNRAKEMGIDIKGPLPPDTVFFYALKGNYDAVICLYHDQGLIPFKLLHFEDGVNVTLGLPIVRTSVDHGTAYDIAGTGKAKPDSLLSAIDLAALISKNRQRATY